MTRSFLLIAMFCTPLTAQAATLISDDAGMTVSDNGTITVWRVEPGGSDNVFLSSLYLRRAGESGESTLSSSLGLIEETQNSPDTLRRSYGGNGLDARVDYTLSGGVSGSRSSTFTRSVTLTNTTDTQTSFALFDYTDFDIRFDPLNQRDQATLIAPGVIETVSTSVPFAITTTVTPTPDAHQITDFLTAYFAFFIDQDGATILPSTPAIGEPFPIEPGDNAFAFEWGISLDAGESITISQTSTLAPIPLPASALLLLFGLAGFAAFRRR